MTTQTDQRVQVRLDKWKENLLDTSRRNRLLYFKSSGAGTVRITEPTLDEVWKRLVVGGKSYAIYQELPGDGALNTDDNTEEGEEPVTARPRKSDEIKVELFGKKLTHVLYQLQQRSRTSLQEQGVVTLFAAFGLLNWTEVDDPETEIVSPLILAPVTINRDSSRSSYRLSLFEEDAVLNPALVFKLQTDYKLSLPELPSIDQLDLGAYLQKAEELVTARRNWRVFRTAHIGLFSFHKIAMYNDLKEHANRAVDHPIVRALGGDPSRLPTAPQHLPRGSGLDVIPPEENFQVVDADSSQQEAIEAARRGVSFVLQGPPGTGKSQTITNIIAVSLAANKRVLFVSEKMAALEVVQRR